MKIIRGNPISLHVLFSLFSDLPDQSVHGPSCHSRCRCTQQKLRWRQATTGKVDTSCSAMFKFKCRPGWNQRVSTAHRLGINSPRLSILNVLFSFSQMYHTGHYGNLTNTIDVCAGENVHVLLPVNDLKTRRARDVWNTQIPRHDGSDQNENCPAPG